LGDQDILQQVTKENTKVDTKFYHRFFEDKMYNRFMSDTSVTKTGKAQKRRSLFGKLETNQDLQKYVDQQHILNKSKLILPLAVGEMYRHQFLDRWLKRK
jgi:hypothetical protein